MAATVTMTQPPSQLQALKNDLQAHHITREQIAAAASVSETYVSHWWNGRRAAPRVKGVALRMLGVAKAKAGRAAAKRAAVK